MSRFWERATEGELMIDHRASPGLPEDFARRHGLDPTMVGEGKLYETFTKGCPHCGACVVMNPDRRRERPHCFKCNHYICDGCAQIAAQPNYVHRTFKEAVDLVQAGRILSGTPLSPLLPLGGNQNG